MNLDHLRYNRERSYRRATNAALRRQAGVAGLNQLTVVHQDDHSCCRIEAWPNTLARLIEALNDDGLKAAGVVAGVDGLGMLLPNDEVEA